MLVKKNLVCDGGSSNHAAINILLSDTAKQKGQAYVHECKFHF